jgi:CRISPR-associated endonuclease/helicase Cas3
MALLKKKSIKMPLIDLNQCIAKTIDKNNFGMSVEEHCRIVGHVSKALYKRIHGTLKRRIGTHAPTIAATHDVGKVSVGFQKKLYDIVRGCSDNPFHSFSQHSFEYFHAVISESETLKNLGDHLSAKAIGSVHGMHHGKRTILPLLSEVEKYGGKEWSLLREKLFQKLVEEFGAFKEKQYNQTAIELLASFVCLSDWIGSDEKNFNPQGGYEIINRKAHKVVRNLGWEKADLKKGVSFKEAFEFEPNEMQRVFTEVVKKPGAYVLEAPMGKGKTEAGLWAAYKMMDAGYNDGIYFALPTRLTSNKIYERIQPFLLNTFKDKTAPKLVHGHSWLTDLNLSGEFKPGGAWFTPNRRAMLMPFGVGTIDQALMSVLRVKYNFIRKFGLFRKVVILDEIHSFDVYTGSLLDFLIQELLNLGCTVIILSATLTAKRRSELLGLKSVQKIVSYPLITKKEQSQGRYISVRNDSVKSLHYSVKKTSTFPVTKMIQKARAGACVLCIANSVDKAVVIYESLKKLNKRKKVKLGLLHSRFQSWSRNERENEWFDILGKKAKNRQGCILISTQVVEQSVDLDADILITEIAPSDMILQRMGRVWRHERKNRQWSSPEVWIVRPPVSKLTNKKVFEAMCNPTTLIYPSYIIWRSIKVWEKIKSVSFPKDIRTILEKTYRNAGANDPQWVQDIFNDFCSNRFALKNMAMLSSGTHVDVVDDDEDNIHTTRHLSVPTVKIILVKSFIESKDDLTLEFFNGIRVHYTKGLVNRYVARVIHENMITVPVINGLNNVSPYEPFEKLVYGKVILASVNTNDEIILSDGTHTGYLYDPEKGVYK